MLGKLVTMVQPLGASENSGFGEKTGVGFGDGEQSPLFPPGFGVGFEDGHGWGGTRGVDGLGDGSKRMRVACSNQQIATPLNSSQGHSPLGLTLRKTPSFVELIELKLSQSRNASPGHAVQKFQPEEVKVKCEDNNNNHAISEKLKASNFPAAVLKIGSWERVSRYEGDLVAKCYYAKRKLVWEVLDSGLKSKIEIQWSDICGIRAMFQENDPGILEIELNHAPLFFRETNPQPRKHTIWRAASDFTGGQAPIYRRHYLQFPNGILEKHYEKLLQCDSKLLELSRRPFPTMQSPFFYSSQRGFQDCSSELNTCKLDFFRGSDIKFKDGIPSKFPPYDAMRPGAVVPTSQDVQNFEQLRPAIGADDSASLCSVIDCGPTEGRIKPLELQKAFLLEKGYRNQADIMDRNGILFHELPAITSRRESHPGLISSNGWDLNKIARHLLLDTGAAGGPDNVKLLTKVKSMCSLLDASSSEDNLSECIGMQLEDSSQDNSINDWAASEISKMADHEKYAFSSTHPLGWLTAPMSTVNSQGLGIPNASYPLLFPNQIRDDGFAIGETPVLWTS